jgi:hypothetical protein
MHSFKTSQKGDPLPIPKCRASATTTHEFTGSWKNDDHVLVISPQVLKYNEWKQCHPKSTREFLFKSRKNCEELPNGTQIVGDFLVITTKAFDTTPNDTIKFFFATNNRDQIGANQAIVFFRFVSQWYSRSKQRVVTDAVPSIEPFVFTICQKSNNKEHAEDVGKYFKEILKDQFEFDPKVDKFDPEVDNSALANSLGSNDAEMRRFSISRDLFHAPPIPNEEGIQHEETGSPVEQSQKQPAESKKRPPELENERAFKKIATEQLVFQKSDDAPALLVEDYLIASDENSDEYDTSDAVDVSAVNVSANVSSDEEGENADFKSLFGDESE